MKHLAVVITAFLAAAAAAVAQPSISFGKNLVTVKGITAGGRVACYGVAHDFVDTYPGIYRWGRETVDADGDGAVSIELPREVPARSVWACTDVATGVLAMAAPDKAPLVEIPLLGRGALASAKGNDIFSVESERVDLLLIRPGEGAWLLLTGDGGDTDGDKSADGAVNARPDDFQGIGAMKTAAASFKSGGTIVALYPLTLEFSVVPLGRH